jgi:lysylphosphatidylglycerol synthetase-like protein (DUF2156 family)/membrane protein DedA with SNARE-associated domain
MEALLLRYGYLLVFLGVALEGEVVLLAAAALCHSGYFRLALVMGVAVAANWTADQVYYLLARSYGRDWLEKRYGRHPRYERVLSLMDRYGNVPLLFSRYVFGFRIIIPAACGALGMPLVRFGLLNLLAGVIWVVPTASLGYSLGAVSTHLSVGLSQYRIWVTALLVLLAGMLWLAADRAKRLRLTNLRWGSLHQLVPYLIALMGVIDLISALWPRSAATFRLLKNWLPFGISQQSRPVLLCAGLALLQVARHLLRRQRLAWVVSILALSVSMLSHLTHAMDWPHSLFAGILLAYLIHYRGRFSADSDVPSLQRAVRIAPVLCVLILLYGTLGLNELRSEFTWKPDDHPLKASFRAGILILDPALTPNTAQAAHFLESLQWGGWLVRFYLLTLLLRPVLLRRRLQPPAEALQRIFQAHGEHSLAAFAIHNDKHHLFVAGGRGLVAYAVRGSVAMACGDPLAPEEQFQQSLDEYLRYCRQKGWTPVIYEASEARLFTYRAVGMKWFKIAEEAILDLTEFSLAGNKRANLRAMVNKAKKAGMTVQAYHRKHNPVPSIDSQLEAVSQEWLADKRLGELGFTLGHFSLEGLNEVPVFIAVLDDHVHAFCSWVPYKNGKAVALDLMRKRSDAMSGTMDLLLAQSLQQLRATGIIEASLGSAPLASVTQREGVLDHAVALLFEHFNRFYGYKSLFQFKKKFAPQWEGRYLVYPSGADLLRIFYALTRLHRSAGLGQFIMRRLSDATAFLGHHLYVFRLVQWVSSGSKHLES